MSPKLQTKPLEPPAEYIYCICGLEENNFKKALLRSRAVLSGFELDPFMFCFTPDCLFTYVLKESRVNGILVYPIGGRFEV